MFASLVAARRSLDEIAQSLDASALAPEVALRMVDEFGAIRRVVDGMLAKTAKRVTESDLVERDGAALVARTLGVRTGEVRAALETAARLEALPATDAAVREGRLSASAAEMIAIAATANPGAEDNLLRVAADGLVPLKDACIKARAAVEDPTARRARQHRLREFHSWTDSDGMIAGRYRLTPEVGGAVTKAIEAGVQRIFRSRTAGTDHEPNCAYAADAFAGFVLGGAKGTQTANDEPAESNTSQDPRLPKGIDIRLNVMIDHGVMMRGGTADGEVCEIPGVGPVDVNWVKELLGSAFVTAIIKKGKNIVTVAHLGRHIPAEVQTALLVSGRECDVEGCNHRGYLERDHHDDYARGGATSFANLGWLCYRHHRLKSSGWILGPADPVTRKRTLRQPPDEVRRTARIGARE